MKNILVIVSIVFLFISCDNGDMEKEKGVVAPENEGKEYLTITYHGNGHTSGEVPVDTRKYPVPRGDRDPTLVPPNIVQTEVIPCLMEPGTMKKEGYYFWGWVKRDNPDLSTDDIEYDINEQVYYTASHYSSEEEFLFYMKSIPSNFMYAVSTDTHFYAIWYPNPKTN